MSARMSEETKNDGESNLEKLLRDLSSSESESSDVEVPTMENSKLYKDVRYLADCRTPFKKEPKAEWLIRLACHDLSSSLRVSKEKTQLIALQKQLKAMKGFNQNPKKCTWGVPYIASKIASMHCLWMDYSKKHPVDKHRRSTRSGKKGSVPDCINWLSKVGKIIDAALKDQHEAQDAERLVMQTKATKKATASKKKMGARPQDAIEFDVSKADPERCPRCKHHCVMVIDDEETVAEQNAEIARDYQTRLRRFNALLPAAKKDQRRPARGRTVEQRFGCFCYKNHCLNQPSGGGCYQCRSNKEQGVSFLSNGRCTCDICKCSCDLVFGRSQRTQIESATDPYRPDAVDNEPKNGSQLINLITDTVVTRTFEEFRRNPMAPSGDTVKNACSHAFIDLTTNPNLGTARFRKTMQESMGEIPKTSKDGLRIGQLREQKYGTVPRPSDDSRHYRNGLIEENESFDMGNGGDENRNFNSPMVPESNDSAPRPRALIARPTPVTETKAATPEFTRGVRKEAVRLSIVKDNSPDTAQALDTIARSLRMGNSSDEAIDVRSQLDDIQEILPEEKTAVYALTDYVKRRKVSE